VRLHLSAIGRLRSGPEQELAADYLDRASKLGRRAGFASIAVHEFAESRAASAVVRRKDEAARLLAAPPAGAFLIALDEEGRELSSSGLAEELRRRRDAGVADLSFLIGGPDGHDPGIADKAQLTLSLGPMTWPHRLVRVMLAEQIYRSVTILINHPYHRA
jgi:23S rRNA (pseudouridine1915-N3)-methyltransferase